MSNARFSRRVAALTFIQQQYQSCCERTQREK
jgi:hypothetical protein